MKIGVDAVAQTDSDVYVVGNEIGIAQAGRDPRVDVGMCGHEPPEPRNQPLCG